MRTSNFDYRLPEELIAQHAVARGDSRMLVLDRGSGEIGHRTIRDFPRYLGAEDVLLINDTRVISARLEARRPTGRRFEVFLLEDHGGDRWEGLVRPSARAREGEALVLPDGGRLILGTPLGEGRWELEFDPPLDVGRLDEIGSTPLPPYIRRPEGPEPGDRERYQTVYAGRPGAVAAPTAGLHFDERLLAEVEGAGVEIVRVTLHVGIGTFRPVAVEKVAEHRMHSERYHFSREAAEACPRPRARPRPRRRPPQPGPRAQLGEGALRASSMAVSRNARAPGALPRERIPEHDVQTSLCAMGLSYSVYFRSEQSFYNSRRSRHCWTSVVSLCRRHRAASGAPRDDISLSARIRPSDLAAHARINASRHLPDQRLPSPPESLPGKSASSTATGVPSAIASAIRGLSRMSLSASGLDASSTPASGAPSMTMRRNANSATLTWPFERTMNGSSSSSRSDVWSTIRS